MLDVTDSALEHLADALSNVRDENSPNRCFRIVAGERSELGLSLSVPETDDKIFEYDGHRVLALPNTFKALTRTLDLKDGKLVLT